MLCKARDENYGGFLIKNLFVNFLFGKFFYLIFIVLRRFVPNLNG